MRLVSALLAAAVAAGGVACQAPPPRGLGLHARGHAVPQRRASEGVCADLAYTFRLVAQQRDLGVTKQEQIEATRKMVRSPFVRQKERTLGHLLTLVDLVYLNDEASAHEIEGYVLENCVVSEQGHAVLKRLWPVQ